MVLVRYRKRQMSCSQRAGQHRRADHSHHRPAGHALWSVELRGAVRLTVQTYQVARGQDAVVVTETETEDVVVVGAVVVAGDGGSGHDAGAVTHVRRVGLHLRRATQLFRLVHLPHTGTVSEQATYTDGRTNERTSFLASSNSLLTLSRRRCSVLTSFLRSLHSKIKWLFSFSLARLALAASSLVVLMRACRLAVPRSRNDQCVNHVLYHVLVLNHVLNLV